MDRLVHGPVGGRDTGGDAARRATLVFLVPRVWQTLARRYEGDTRHTRAAHDGRGRFCAVWDHQPRAPQRNQLARRKDARPVRLRFLSPARVAGLVGRAPAGTRIGARSSTSVGRSQASRGDTSHSLSSVLSRSRAGHRGVGPLRRRIRQESCAASGRLVTCGQGPPGGRHRGACRRAHRSAQESGRERFDDSSAPAGGRPADAPHQQGRICSYGNIAVSERTTSDHINVIVRKRSEDDEIVDDSNGRADAQCVRLAWPSLTKSSPKDALSLHESSVKTRPSKCVAGVLRLLVGPPRARRSCKAAC